MKVLVADKFEKSGLEGLAALGCQVLSEPDLKEDALEARLKESEAPILIVRSTKVTEAMIEGSSLRLIIRAGAGYNTIDTVAASTHGVYVCNCPGKNAAAVAELAMGLILAIDRRIPENVSQFREGKWNKKEFSKARGIAGETLGLVGLGNIGREMITRAKAFGMNVIAHSHHTSPDDAARYGIELVSLSELARRSSIVSVHCSLNANTKGLLGDEFFAELSNDAIFINTSRSEVVVEAALIAAIENGLRAGLDVFDNEPVVAEGETDSPLTGLSGAYVTHHIGASTNQAQEAVASETVRIVEEFIQGATPPNAVNSI
ncbi:MAG: NAD(P)-dependent oxidoreductase [Fimbriimonadaceae bacterium]